MNSAASIKESDFKTLTRPIGRECNIYKFEYKFDKQRLLAEAKDLKGYMFILNIITGIIYHDYAIKYVNIEEDESVLGVNGLSYAIAITKQFQQILGYDCKPRFYCQKQGYTIPYHTDSGPSCSINFVLSDTPDPIKLKVRGTEITEYYTVALLDTQVCHSVGASTKDRYLFKLSIFDKSYEEIKNLLANPRTLP